MDSDALVVQDLSSIWHPCMQMKDFENMPLIPIQKASGVYLHDFSGNKYIDGISSWWVNNLGHSNKRINDAVKAQLDDFAHVMTANLTHKPMIALAQKLIKKCGNNLTKVFFADNGSSAIEAALKLSFQYFKNIGQTRDLFVAFENSYHGETLGALSVGDVGLYKKTYEELLLKTVISLSPKDKSDEETDRAIVALDKTLEKLRGRVSAVIIEPLVQCAGYMRMHSPLFIKALRNTCDRHGVHLILDEIAVGFGRTGSFFAHEQSGITPDIMCLSKGITGGYMPLSVVMCKEQIYEAFYRDGVEMAFLHSHSYSGNALGCAAANAVMDIFEEDDIIKKLAPKISKIEQSLEELKNDKRVKNIRQTGMIAAFELETSLARPSLEIFKEGLKQGIFIRPLANTIYIMPPLIINEDEIEALFFGIKKSLTKV
jgi:adenosylmethionine-8-amino-7-oxononanoate aminotransferase